MKKITLTESALRKIVKESVRKMLSERTRFEAGLSDDEVSRMRTNRFANDVDPHYGDSIYDDEQERYMDKMHGRRLSRHFATQKHKPNPLDTEVNEGLVKEWYDVDGKYVEGWAELVEDLRVRLIGTKHGFGVYKYKHDIMYNHSKPYNRHMMKAIEYVNMALKELYQAKEDFMDESNFKQQPSQP